MTAEVARASGTIRAATVRAMIAAAVDAHLRERRRGPVRVGRADPQRRRPRQDPRHQGRDRGEASGHQRGPPDWRLRPGARGGTVRRRQGPRRVLTCAIVGIETEYGITDPADPARQPDPAVVAARRRCRQWAGEAHHPLGLRRRGSAHGPARHASRRERTSSADLLTDARSYAEANRGDAASPPRFVGGPSAPQRGPRQRRALLCGPRAPRVLGARGHERARRRRVGRGGRRDRARGGARVRERRGRRRRAVQEQRRRQGRELRHARELPGASRSSTSTSSPAASPRTW